jgi:hypothetical protein
MNEGRQPRDILPKPQLREQPTICIFIRPASVIVLIASVGWGNPVLASWVCSITLSKSRSERDNRSNFQTTSTSPLRSWRVAVTLGAIPPTTGGLLAEDAFTARRPQWGCLGRGVLFVRWDARLTDEHCGKVLPLLLIMQYINAMRRTPKVEARSIVAQTAVCAIAPELATCETECAIG